jgi:aspartyl-tRNA synthetase
MLLRTHTCGQLRDSHVGQTVRLNGWVNSYRDHGTGLVFIDLRDRFGLTQLVFDKDGDLPKASSEPPTSSATRTCRGRGHGPHPRIGGENPKLITGKVEVVVSKLELLNKTANPPVPPR